MKRTLIFATLVLAALTAGTADAQETEPVPSRVTAATIFLHGAEVTHTASLNLKKGADRISVEGLSPDADPASVKINIGGGVVVSAHEFSTDYLSSEKAPSARLRMLKDSMEFYRAQLDKVRIDIEINDAMKEYLSTGISKNISGSESGLGIDELKRTMDYFEAKSQEILGAERKLRERQTTLTEVFRRVSNQHDEESGTGRKTSGVLHLTLSTPSAGTFPVTITYYTPSASWSPYYDINAGAADRPITIAARSRVSQTTGLDWENVRLTLSTATPSNGKVAPVFSTWFLRERTFPIVGALQGKAAGVQPTRNSISLENFDENVLEEVVVVRGSANVARRQTQEPLYIVDGIPRSEGIADIDPAMIADIEVLKDISQTAVYGSRGANGVVVVTLRKSMSDFVTLSESALDVTYDIDLPYSIPGNGKEQNIDLETKEAAAEYRYYCAPKLDRATYLIAEISNPESLGLLSAPANITYDGTYIGETWINAGATQEKLTLTLGIDRRVSVTRELAREFNAPRALGFNVEQTFTYRITVRNSRTEPVTIVLKDQYPVSTDKSIVVTLDRKNTTPWTLNKEDLGVVTWEGSLAAGEVRPCTLSYTVRYPKGTQLDL